MKDLAQFIAAADRYPIYKQMRDETPVLRVDWGAEPMWILTRHADVNAMLRDPNAFVRAPGDGTPGGFTDPATVALFNNQMLMSDPPEHDRLRKLANPAFSPASINALHDWVAEMVEARVTELAERGSFDMVKDLAAYVPGKTILKILGIPEEDWEPLLGRVPAFLNFFSPFPLNDEKKAATEEACRYYYEYFGAIVSDRMRNPGDDIVGRLVTAHADDDRLSRDELICLLKSFLVAGFETTNSALGSCVYGILSQGDPWRQLRADPSLAPIVIEESLRWEAPIHFNRRFAGKDIRIGDEVIPAGGSVLNCMASANRDERVFPDPDRIDLQRPSREYTTFGAGRHFCLGSHLAKMEARTVLSALARLIPTLELAESNPERHYHFAFTALPRLLVRRG